LIEAGSGFLPWIVEQAGRAKREEDQRASEETSAVIAPEPAPLSAKPRNAPAKKRADRTVPKEVQAEVNAWLARNAVRDNDSTIGATELFEAYQETGGQLKQARFGAAVRALGGDRKGGNGNRLVYRGIALRGSEPMLSVVGGSEASP
jgi:hypothetical protein